MLTVVADGGRTETWKDVTGMGDDVLEYAGRKFTVTAECAGKIARKRLTAEFPARWVDIDCVDGKTVSLLFSSGVPVTLQPVDDATACG